MKKLEVILEEIQIHNQAIYDSTPKSMKIDFSKTKVNWGSNVIPKEFHLDLSKTHTLRNGWKIENLTMTLFNSNDKEVTYPIKGTYIEPRVGKSNKRHFDIWTLDGRKDCNVNSGPLDLIAA
jgi:hypothetical protein